MAGFERNWDSMRRALLIIRALRQGPANRNELMAAVAESLPDAYADLPERSQRRAFERDLENARERLAATIAWNGSIRAYELHDAGPFVQAELTDDALGGLAFLMNTFNPNEEVARFVQPLLDWVTSAVTEEQLRTLNQSPSLSVSLQRLSEQEIAPDVWRLVNIAIRNRRMLKFEYGSPIHKVDDTRLHTVEPYGLLFREGHYYLRAYRRRWLAPNGFSGGEGWATPYRLDYIRSGTCELRANFVPRESRPTTETIRYKLHPRIVRGGISRYFDKMQVGEADENGWVTISAETDNLFDAHRILLRYGEMCVALSPPRLVDYMARAAHGMADQYPKPDENSAE